MTIDISIMQNSSKNLYFLLHDFDWTRDHKPRSLSIDFSGGHELPDDKGFPETVVTLEKNFSNLTKPWQFNWFEHLKIEMAGESLIEQKSDWRYETRSDRAFTNGRGTDKYRDYISKRNLLKPLPAIESLSCGGNVVEVIEGNYKTIDGVRWLAVRTLQTNNGKLPPPSIAKVNRINHPELIHVATVSTPILLPDGTYLVNSFRDPNGNLMVFPFVSRTGINYIAENRMIKLTGAIPSPFNP